MGCCSLRRLVVVVVVVGVAAVSVGRGDGAQWCIARSGASEQALQSALDYACGLASADCQPIQPSGPCYLPNTLPAHASYAFNSFYQRSRGASDACNFAGAAMVTVTDPSYGSCTFPSSASTAGGATTPATGTPNTMTPTTPPVTTTPTSPGTGMGTPSGGGGNVSGQTPIGGLSPGNGLTPGTGSTTAGGNASGLTPIGGLTPGIGLTPGTGINSGTGTVPDADYSGSSALLFPSLLLLFKGCCFLSLLL